MRATEEESQKITLPDLKVEDLKRIFKVAAYWDTLGWVDERMSNLEEAEQYLPNRGRKASAFKPRI